MVDSKLPRRRSRVKSSIEWKPSLCSISEDRVVTAASPGDGTGAWDRRTVVAKADHGRAVRKSGGNGSQDRVYVRGSSDDYEYVIRYTR